MAAVPSQVWAAVERRRGDGDSPPLPKPTRLTIGSVGHRQLLRDDLPPMREAVRGFLLRLRGEFPRLPLQVIAALQGDADRLVVEVALALEIEVLVPRIAAAAESGASPETARFDDLIGRCQTLDLPDPPGPGGECGHDATVARRARLGAFISSHSQILLALWDGRPADSPGATGDVVHFHIHERMPVFDLTAPAPNRLADDRNDLVFHIPCRRARDGAVATPAQPPRWLVAEREWPGEAPIPEEYRVVFAHMQTFNEDLTRYAEAIQTDSCSMIAAEPDGLGRDRATLHLDALFREADWLAIHYQRQVRRGLLATHLLAVLMGAAFITYDNVVEDPALLAVFLLAFAAGWLWYRTGQRRDWHRKYLDYRALAEGLRVQLYWHLASVRAENEILFAYDSFLQKQNVELGWIRHVMRNASLLQDRRQRPDPRWLDWTVAHWIGDADSGQLGYYRRKCAQCQAHYRMTRRLGALALLAGIGIALLLLLLGDHLPEGMAAAMLVLVGLLPLIAGIREAYSHKKADKELVKQYRFMTGIFERACRQLEAGGDQAIRREVLRALGEACLEEHTEWLLMHRERPLEHSQMA